MLAAVQAFIHIIEGFVKQQPASSICNPGVMFMHKITPAFDEDESALPFKTLNAEEAREWRQRHTVLSPWYTIAAQALCGFLACLVAKGVTGSAVIALSVAYGALAVVVPAAVFARGMAGRLASLSPATAVVGFFVWELVKIALTASMLLLAPRAVAGLSWPAMLVGLVLTMQVYWLALLLAPKKLKQDAGREHGC